MMKVFKSLKFLVLVSLVLAPNSLIAGENHPCKSDVQKFCKDVEKGGGRVIKCLKQHEMQLSQECKIKTQERRERAKELSHACKGDVEKFCSGIQPGDGRVAKCLKSHGAELSSACKAKREIAKERRKSKRKE